MLHVKIDLVPQGREEERTTLTNLYLANVTPGEETADYEVWLSDPRRSHVEPTLTVKNHERADGALVLVARACAALSGSLELPAERE